ncbi:hypothetical protein ASD31_15390 [Rhizobium sp. Root482]|nr:hypothetical protein ASD31_15390 [Rhizobium sp. Root482]
MLAGDPVLMPLKDGVLDWDSVTRDTLTKISHWSDIEIDDMPRLAILTDSFARFIGKGEDASVVTAWRDGTPEIRQIDGEPCIRAVDLIAEAIADDVSLEEMLGLPFAEPFDAPKEPPSKMRADLDALAEKFEARNTPVAANDNLPADERLLPYLAAYGGPNAIITAGALFGAVVDGVAGQIRIMDDGRALFASRLASRYITLPVKPKRLTATRFSLRSSTAIPQREWLHAAHYMRRFLTVTVGAGGGGKSAHAVTEALAMVTGRPLLDPYGPLTKPLRVWLINAEDPADEIERRVTAAAIHFGINAEAIGDRLFTDSGRDQEFVIMRQEGRDTKVCEPMIADMLDAIRQNQIDVVVLDPFVSSHEVPENDNSLIQRVAKAWLRVADEGNCSVELIHHVTKGNFEVTADSARGGGALKDKARSVRTINPMTKEEAERAGLDDPHGYFRIDFGKANMVARTSSSEWRRFEPVSLGNGKGLLSAGDSIGVVEPWCWPTRDAIAERAAAERSTLISDVPAETLAGLKTRLSAGGYKASAQASSWAGKLVAEFFDIDLTIKSEKRRVKEMLAAWIDAGELEIVQLQDAYRRVTPHVKPVAAPPV